VTTHRKRTPGEWLRSKWILDDLVIGRPYPTFWEAHRASLLVLVVLACLLVAWLVWGGRG
jgi:hypothetical protein